MSTNGSSSGKRVLPTILSSRSVFGIVPCTSRRNVSWNSDGQCLLVSKQGVTVATPYLMTTLPKPELMLDTSMQGGKADDEEEEDEREAEGEKTGRRLARPRRGEIDWWMTAVGLDKGKGREDEYGWVDVGDEFNGIVTDRDKERAVRAATWSPSGLSELGCPFIAVMTNTEQVSIFAPGDDLYTKSFVELADITRASLDLLDEEDISDSLTVRGLLRVRATAMEWSPPVPLPSMIGIDGSLLAIANRAGGIDFWAYSDGEFLRVTDETLPKPWAVEVTWSRWTMVDGETCTARLATATTDGGVWILPVTRLGNPGNGSWEIGLGELEPLAPADNRAITLLQWLDDDFLVWAKAGSIHLKHTSWPQPKVVRLERVGNWAGCNALSACVGLQLSGTTLTVVLSTLTYHVIHNATTEPVLAPPIDSLRATLAARDVLIDCARRRRRGFYTADDREYTAHTAGWAAMEPSGDIVSWMAEPITFHNLDSATEVSRISDFVLADLKTLPGHGDEIIKALNATLDNPPNLLHHSPLGIMIPHLLRLIMCEEPMGAPLLEVVSQSRTEPAAEFLPASTSLLTLQQSLWGIGAPDALRLRLTLAQWGQRAYPNLAVEFGAAIDTIQTPLQVALAVRALRWAASVVRDSIGPLDAQYLGYLFAVCDAPQEAERLRALAADAGGATCPACGGTVHIGGGRSAFCERGHEWERCSVTHLLITTPEYRLCTVCPAVSLLPDRVSDANVLVRLALQAAVPCPTCGGRWSRAI